MVTILYGEAKLWKLVAMAIVVFQAETQKFPKASILLNVVVVARFTLDTK
jgi:hypothetical protein